MCLSTPAASASTASRWLLTSWASSSPGADALELTADEDVRLILLGGPPFGEQIVMWWNFIGREHEEVVGYRAQWEALLAEGDRERFDLPEDDPREALHAPPLPNARMVKRGP